jgi:hypothetical protein
MWGQRFRAAAELPLGVARDIVSPESCRIAIRSAPRNAGRKAGGRAEALTPHWNPENYAAWGGFAGDLSCLLIVPVLR